MGTEVHFKSYSPVCYSTNDHNTNANSVSWPRCYEDKTVNAGSYYEPFLQMQSMDGYSESDREELKQAMLKHEVIFRNQVHELHRLYGVQKDFMDKLKRNEVQKQGLVEEFHSSRIPPEDLQNLWRHSQNHLNSTHHASTSSFMNCQLQQPSSKNGSVKLDLQLSADEYLASEEVQQMGKDETTRVSVEDGYPLKKYCRIASKNDTNCRNPSSSSLKRDAESKRDLADLNEEFHFEEATTDVPVDVTNLPSFHSEKQEKNFISNPKSVFVGLSMEYLHNSRRGRDDRMYINIQHVENKDGWHGFDIHAHQSDSGPRSLPVSSWINPKRIPSLVSEDEKSPADIDVKSTKCMDLNLVPSGGLEVGRTPHDFGLPNLGKIFGFPIVNRVLGSKDLSSEVLEAQYSAKLENLRTDLACRNHTISNSCMEEEEALVNARTLEMDLEVPAEPDALEDVVTVEDSPRKELEKHIQSSESRTGTPQKPVTSETHDYETSVRDPLLWFAEVATSTTDDLESTRCVIDDDELSCGMDYFESMTLKLTETKLDEYYPKNSVPDPSKEVTDGFSIMNKHCRGKGRRGGQQRNFQRDILPGFASLAKHEISEDLEMLKGLMRSMGHSWQIGEARKNAAKSGRGRGRRSPRGSNPLLASTYCV